MRSFLRQLAQMRPSQRRRDLKITLFQLSSRLFASKATHLLRSLQSSTPRTAPPTKRDTHLHTKPRTLSPPLGSRPSLRSVPPPRRSSPWTRSSSSAQYGAARPPGVETRRRRRRDSGWGGDLTGSSRPKQLLFRSE